MIGQTVSHYRILDKLGEGGMGVVYVAEDTHLGRRVAIKFPADSLDEHNFRARFLREARAISTLSHQHIAAIYDYGETADGDDGKTHPFIVMELVKGPSLADLMHGEGLTLKRAVKVVTDVADALSEAHHHGIIHRDIKPSNVLMSERGEVKVLDFGLAKQLHGEHPQSTDPDARTLLATRTRSGTVVGTPLYLSPEQARGAHIDGRSDLFALGALLYECITGKPAFAGSGVLEIAGQVLHVNPPPPSSINPLIPPELDRITMKALAKNVDERYQSADEMLTDLREVSGLFVDTETPRTERLTAPKPAHSSALNTITETLRRPRLSLGLFLIVIALAGLTVWGVMRWRHPTPYQPSAAAQRWYDNGTTALRDGSYYQASRAFEQAIVADDNFALAHARYAEALMELDYVDKAKDELLRVSALAPDRSALTQIDALYLDAITATVRRDFPHAIEAYDRIARLSPNQPQVYVDLGRAFENNEDTKKAIESYLKATTLDQQYATAYLRLGILYGRRQELPSATASFDKADATYQAMGNVEGRAEVAFQRGVLFVKLGKIADARPSLQQALDLARAINNQPQIIKTMLQLATVSQSVGETAQAQKLAGDAVGLAQANNMEDLTARGLIDLGNGFLLRSEYAEAETYYKQALELAQRHKTRRNEARALLSLGSLRIQQGNADEAVRYIEQALPFYQQGGYRKEVSQALLLLGRANLLKGDYEAALHASEQQLELAEQVSDQSQQALSHGDIGNVLVRQERYVEALEHFEKKYSISKSLGDQKGVGYGAIGRASALWQLGRYDEASALLDEAFALANRPDGGFKSLLVNVYQSNAEMALSQRLFPLAREKSQQALALAGTQSQGEAIEAKRILGLALTFSGAAREGKQSCEEALTAAMGTNNPLLISKAQLALGEALLESGDAQGALTNALRAEESFARSGQQALEWRALLVAARASRRASDEAKGHEYAAHASELLSGLEKKWGAEVYNSYLTRMDVQTARKQLNELSQGN
ncbi:MAG: eukaryotic-like serine/threonine-protein kinase [Acidobacteriota bacterium]|jgi:serine/threonine protein kinase/Flp pilus assembly protein TadD|nr:eukaryotic-like serine/threonine-protein kinase [Acidobacteriota bacterium]